MGNFVVLVDAGYLFAAGSLEALGQKHPRHGLLIDIPAVFAELMAVARLKGQPGRLLRVYWYDAARPASGRTAEHAGIAGSDHIKLRLGVLNSDNEQKGVDSLIVSDLIELARHRAIDDAVLVSGDEDVRIGVQVAQTLGIRVHLVGIRPSNANQSPSLREEADTNTEWDKDVVARFLSVKEQPAEPLPVPQASCDAKATVADIPTSPRWNEILPRRLHHSVRGNPPSR